MWHFIVVFHYLVMVDLDGLRHDDLNVVVVLIVPIRNDIRNDVKNEYGIRKLSYGIRVVPLVSSSDGISLDFIFLSKNEVVVLFIDFILDVDLLILNRYPNDCY